MLLRRSTRSTRPTRSMHATTSGGTGDRSSKQDSRLLHSHEGLVQSSKRSRKGSVDGSPQAPTQVDGLRVPGSPSTPKRRRTSVQKSQSLPETPTPALVGIMSAAVYSAGDVDDATSPPTSPTADLHVTNAPFATPDGGTQTTAFPPNAPDHPSTQLGADCGPRPSATKSSILSKGCAHLLSVEPSLGPLIRKHPCHIFSPAGLAEKVDPFRSLVSGILAQQVSGLAAKAITNKFIALFREGNGSESQFPSPAQVAAVEVSYLRSAGLSQRKAEYVRGLAEKFESGELSTSMLLHTSDEEVMEKLIAVRGLGRWSVEMFTCFGLKRMDVFSTGDLGVQRGMAAFMGKDVSRLKAKGGGKWKYMSENDMLEGSEKFRPYRSLFMWYMWRAENVDISTVEGRSGAGD